MEKQVELTPGHGGTGNPNHGSSRVIRHGRTGLTQDELEEFLKMQNATFGIYKIYVDNKDNCNDIHGKSPPQQQQKQDFKSILNDNSLTFAEKSISLKNAQTKSDSDNESKVVSIAGEIDIVDVDLAMAQDITGPLAIR